MNRLPIRSLLPALALASFAPGADAQVVVRTPGVLVQAGRPIIVQTPGGQVVVPPGAPVMPPRSSFPYSDPGAPPPVPLSPVPSLPPPVRPVIPAPRVMTPAEFACNFKVPKCGGVFETVLLHPYTCQPVKVCFRVPKGGCCRGARFTSNQLVIRYKLCRSVVVRFCPNGCVQVFD